MNILTIRYQLLLISLVAFGLRLYDLDGLSFWYDEGFSARVATFANVQLWANDIHPPLYYALLTVWRLVSDEDSWLRLLSVIFGVGTIPVVYGLGKALFNNRVGLWAATFLAVLAIHIQYSQEIRMYSLMVFLFACAFFGLIVAIRHNHPKGWGIYVVSAPLLAYSHGLGLLYVLVLALLAPLLAETKPRWQTTWKSWFVANALVIGLFVPWYGVYLFMVRKVTTNFWIPAPTWATLLKQFTFLTVQSIPPLSALLQRSYGINTGQLLGRWVWIFPLVAVLGWGLIHLPKDRAWLVRTLIAAYVLPLAVLFAISLAGRPLLITRVILPISIPLVLLLGVAVETFSPWPMWRTIASTIVVTLLLLSTYFHLRYHPYYREEWREASQLLQANVSPGDIIFCSTQDQGPYLINRYDPFGRLKQIKFLSGSTIKEECNTAIEHCMDTVLASYPSGQIIWVIHRGEPQGSLQEKITGQLHRRLQLQASYPFSGITVERMQLPVGTSDSR
jgi:mannosyltransferase